MRGWPLPRPTHAPATAPSQPQKNPQNKQPMLPQQLPIQPPPKQKIKPRAAAPAAGHGGGWTALPRPSSGTAPKFSFSAWECRSRGGMRGFPLPRLQHMQPQKNPQNKQTAPPLNLCRSQAPLGNASREALLRIPAPNPTATPNPKTPRAALPRRQSNLDKVQPQKNPPKQKMVRSLVPSLLRRHACLTTPVVNPCSRNGSQSNRKRIPQNKNLLVLPLQNKRRQWRRSRPTCPRKTPKQTATASCRHSVAAC